MLKRPLFLVTIAFSIGILISGVLHIPLPITAAALGFGCVVAIAARKPTIAVLFVIAALGFFTYEAHVAPAPDDVSQFILSRTSAVLGRVDSDVDLREDRAMLTLSVRSIRIGTRQISASGLLQVSIYKPANVPDWQPPSYGDVLIIHSRISRPSTASNPGFFSWRDYLARQRIYATAYVRDPKQIEILRSSPPNPLMALALKAKQGLSRSILRAMPDDEGSVVLGMDLGAYTTLPDRLLSNFQRTGTLHLLAASGFNCAVLVVVFGFVFVRILKIRKQHAHLALIAILIFYMMMVGAKPSIVRATVMAILLLLGAVINKPSDTINLLFAAGLIILAINPADVFDIGFQLSFVAVLALILVLPTIEATTKRWGIDPGIRPRRAKPISRTAAFVIREGWQGLTATIAATLGTLPLSAHYFNQLSLVSFLVNAIVAATVLPIFVVGLLMPVLSPVPILGTLLAVIGTAITRFALSTINWFGDLPYSCLSVPSPGVLGVIGYYIVLAAILHYLHLRATTSQRRRSTEVFKAANDYLTYKTTPTKRTPGS
jgi:competence protein ComEC